MSSSEVKIEEVEKKESKLDKYVGTMVRKEMLRSLRSYISGTALSYDKDGQPMPISCELKKIVKLTITYRSKKGITLSDVAQWQKNRGSNTPETETDVEAGKFYRYITARVRKAYLSHTMSLRRIEAYCLKQRLNESSCLIMQLLYLSNSKVADNRSRLYSVGSNKSSLELALLIDLCTSKHEDSQRYLDKIKKKQG